MAGKKPNIVFILTDDQGIWSPVCSPARASLLTGRIPSRHGIHDYLSDGIGGCGQSRMAGVLGPGINVYGENK